MENLFNLILIVLIFSFLAACVFGQNLGVYGSMFAPAGNMPVAWLFLVFLFLGPALNVNLHLIILQNLIGFLHVIRLRFVLYIERRRLWGHVFTNLTPFAIGFFLSATVVNTVILC